jgi:hypothetical protein
MGASNAQKQRPAFQKPGNDLGGDRHRHQAADNALRGEIGRFGYAYRRAVNAAQHGDHHRADQQRGRHADKLQPARQNRGHDQEQAPLPWRRQVFEAGRQSWIGHG